MWKSVERDFRRGLLTEQEQNERIIEIWQAHHRRRWRRRCKQHMDPDGNLSTMASSGATKGGFVHHLAAGRHARPDG